MGTNKNMDFSEYNNMCNETSNLGELNLENKKILEAIINATNIGIWIWNIETGNVVINKRYASVIGYRLDELTPFSLDAWKEFVHEGDRKKVKKYLQEQIEGKSQYYDCDLRVRNKDESWIWVHNRGKTIKWDENGKPIMMFGLIFDITERKNNEMEKLKLTTAIEQASVTVIMTDKDGNIQYGNPAFEKISGYSLEEAIGKNPRILKSGLTPDPVFADLWKNITGGKAWEGELINKRKGGTLYYEEARITPIIDSEGNIVNFLAIKQDISQRKYLEEKLKQTSRRDSLTNIYNRRYVFDKLSEIVKLNKIDRQMFSLAIIDIDFFKNVNDTYGHQAGDYILKEFAEILTQSIRTDDILGRYGGEEFVLLLKDTNKQSSAQIIGRILQRIRETSFNFENNEIKITFSCGISEPAEIERDILTVERLVNQADTRLYKAKDTGRNRIVID
ncbi:diguanylate cyclase [Tissierella sp.]|uniref:sensor domain-containing diguanylate cyclase n=1 Tax=Tissierella sp. TaxID=41274 RepID=UPI0028582FE1|nr:diguanylate cyclase [Tissierella sp.]MDR7856624.1 diguanylate cyclase [Tissierella sp.]